MALIETLISIHFKFQFQYGRAGGICERGKESVSSTHSSEECRQLTKGLP